MNRALRIAPRAAQQIRAAGQWWRRNRPRAPEAFAEDLERSFGLVQAMPGIGEPVPSQHLSGLRRLLLARARYHLYYRLDEATDAVEVLALWHTSRGSEPPL